MNESNQVTEEKIMVDGRIHLPKPHPATQEIQRGMKVMSSDGREVGFVAAVIIQKETASVTHILLGHIPVTPDYRRIPVTLVENVDEDTVYLNIIHQAVDKLAVHQPD
jgi:hypothetical protein